MLGFVAVWGVGPLFRRSNWFPQSAQWQGGTLRFTPWIGASVTGLSSKIRLSGWGWWIIEGSLVDGRACCCCVGCYYFC